MHLIIVTVDGYFGQAIPTERSLDLKSLKYELERYGHKAKFMDIGELANLEDDLAEDGVAYLIGSHQNPELKKYIDDVLSTKPGAKFKFLPRRELILAHENKGVQCMLGRRYNLNLPYQEYLYKTKIPDARVVIKHVSGAGSKFVFLAEKSENYYVKLFFSGCAMLTLKDISFYVKKIIKRVIRWKHLTQEYIVFNRRYFRHVMQLFIRSPGYDYKVLVFFDRVYVLRRNQREGDFRASGSGWFIFEKPSQQLVEYAIDFRKKIDAPYISLDLILSDGSFNCIEFQCAHFGPYTQLFSLSYYSINNGELVECPSRCSLEASYGYAISKYLSEWKYK